MVGDPRREFFSKSYRFFLERVHQIFQRKGGGNGNPFSPFKEPCSLLGVIGEGNRSFFFTSNQITYIPIFSFIASSHFSYS